MKTTDAIFKTIGGLLMLSVLVLFSGCDPVVEFSVPDMMCAEGCGETVKGILAKQPGVKEVVVDFEGRTARVTVEEGQFDSKKALDDLVDKQFLNSSVKGGFGREGTPQ